MSKKKFEEKGRCMSAYVFDERQTPKLDAALQQSRDPLLRIPAPKHRRPAHPTRPTHLRHAHNRRLQPRTGRRRSAKQVLAHPLRLRVTQADGALRVCEFFLHRLGAWVLCDSDAKKSKVEGNYKHTSDSRLTELTELMKRNRGGRGRVEDKAKSMRRRWPKMADSNDARDLLKSTG